MNSFENILIKQRGDGIALLTINCAAQQNLLAATTLRELRQSLELLDADSSVRVIILTGAGTSTFATGDDELPDADAAQLLKVIRDLKKPIIAAINGEAIGFGADLALSCHLKVAVQGIRLTGLRANLLSAHLETGCARDGEALRKILDAQSLTVDEAHAWCLVNQVVENSTQLLTACQQLATKIQSNAPLALQFALATVNRGMQWDEDDALYLESSLFSLCFATEDAKEGTRAFLEKRAPKFTGR